ncbi:TetR/AcrR family transcriptional regulator [Nocardia zapadnayensis]|uniref:acyl-CoA-like ligand-binding transcription factor n=1 Tax=Nocardia rhamnosiphila TaxID=426716 RepID=UPI002246CC33|nr:TetR/AcrR family transcriptional regulator [Nocardia zapadnayensis]MCX0275647.1 TetR/AcrR family transcriptional regulator [Nocardia zapadnayensis]
MDDAEPGLRERKKRETRLALSLATIRLSIEKGWDAVTVEEIAAAVGVSDRTFRNYFGSKAEAVASRHLDRMYEIGRLLGARPASEPLWSAITAAVLHGFEVGEGETQANWSGDTRWAEGVGEILSQSAVRGAVLEADALAQRELAAAVAGRVGADPDRDLYPKLVAAVVGSACAIATEHARTTRPPESLAAALRAALTQVAAGLPEPNAGS